MAYKKDEKFDFIRFHVTPSNEEDHILDPICRCNPFMSHKEPTNGNEVWTHRRYNKLTFAIEKDEVTYFNF